MRDSAMTTLDPQSLSGSIARLEQALREQAGAHDRLLEILARKRQAISTADVHTVPDLCRRESALLEHIAQVESQRKAAARDLAAALGLPESSTLRALAEKIGGEEEARLLVLAEQVRSRVQQAHRESSILKTAAESLSAHLASVMQAVQSALAPSRVYGRHGRMCAGAAGRSTVDLTS